MNRVFKKAISAVMMAAALICGTSAVTAHEAVDLSKTDCSLTIEMKYDGKAVSGGTLTLYRVGDIVETNGDFGFAWDPALNCTASITDIESEGTASTVLSCVKEKQLAGTTVTVDTNGNAAFSGLPVGLYLIEQKDPAEGFNTMNPFLISLPQWDDDHYVYSITAAAKTELTKKPVTPPKTPTPTPPAPTPELPYTGLLQWPIPVLFAAGMILIIAGSVLIRKKKYK